MVECCLSARKVSVCLSVCLSGDNVRPSHSVSDRKTSMMILMINVDLVQPPDVAVLVLLVFALDDLHLVLHRLLVEDGADQVGDKPGTSKLSLYPALYSEKEKIYSF